MASTMRAILLKGFGAVDQMYMGTAPKPTVSKNNLLVRVKAAGLNRADLAQRRGKYPPPPGESDIMGLEVAGIVEEVGSEVTDWKEGDKVMALLSGGGYAEYVSVPSEHAMRIPRDFTMERAAGTTETFLTSYQSLFWLGKISAGENILIHGGASGIGTSAIQLARTVPGVRVFTTAGSEEKCRVCEKLGAERAINYKTDPDFAQTIAELTKDDPKGPGVDFILDFVGQKYLSQNLNLLRMDGRLVYLAMLSGTVAEKFELGTVLRKRLSIMGTTLRNRDRDYKTRLIHDFSEYASKMLDEGKLEPVIDRVYDWSQIAEAHDRMENNLNVGKIIINGM